MVKHRGYLSDRMSAEARRLIDQAGLRLLKHEHPWFPDDMVIPGDSHTLDTWEHGTSHPAKHRLPSVLVVPLQFWDRWYGSKWIPQEIFRPYWTGAIRVQDMGDPPPPAQWREASMFEALCAIAQHPHIGSLRCADPCWKQDSAQAYYMPERNAVVLDCIRSDRFHNRMYVIKRQGFQPYFPIIVAMSN